VAVIVAPLWADSSPPWSRADDPERHHGCSADGLPPKTEPEPHVQSPTGEMMNDRHGDVTVTIDEDR